MYNCGASSSNYRLNAQALRDSHMQIGRLSGISILTQKR